MSDKRIPFQVTIGVTGHRTLGDTELLRKTVRSVLDEIVGELTGVKGGDITLCVLSPLAEGTDRLVAEEIIKYGRDSTLSVVLPLASSDYMDDFVTENSKEEFKSFLMRSQSIYSLREKPIAEEYPVECHEQARDQAYENAGKYVVDHSDVLLVLWDGKKPKGKGGTAHIVQYAREQGGPVYIINTQNPAQFSRESTRDDNRDKEK